MGIWVRVTGDAGSVVDELRASVDVGVICEVVQAADEQYPVLAGLDEYDDTVFNGRQVSMLVDELARFAGTTDDVALLAAIAEVVRLAGLVMPARQRPGHRRLVFVGD